MALKAGWEGRYLEDFEVGDVYRSSVGRTITETDNIWFTLLTESDDFHRRRLLAARFDGIGPKEATHLLRNLGRASRMAMLDSWVLKQMVRAGVLAKVPKPLTPLAYGRAEQQYLAWTDRLGIPARHLDLLLRPAGNELANSGDHQRARGEIN